MWVRSLGQEDLLEKEMAVHLSILAYKIPRTEEPDRLLSMGSQRVGHDTHTHTHTHTHTVLVKQGLVLTKRAGRSLYRALSFLI